MALLADPPVPPNGRLLDAGCCRLLTARTQGPTSNAAVIYLSCRWLLMLHRTSAIVHLLQLCTKGSGCPEVKNTRLLESEVEANHSRVRSRTI